MLYERGQMRHLHGLSELEMEMTSWDATDGSPSPNRFDAMVWSSDLVDAGRAAGHVFYRKIAGNVGLDVQGLTFDPHAC